MPDIKLNDLQRFAAYNLAVLWGSVKKAGGIHARKIERIADRFDIVGLEESDRKNRESAEEDRKVYKPTDSGLKYELDEADLEFYHRLSKEYFEKEEGLPDYFKGATENWRVMLKLMEEIERAWDDRRPATKSVEKIPEAKEAANAA